MWRFMLLSLLFTVWVQSRARLARKNKQNDPVALGDICHLGQLLAFGFVRFSVDSTC